MINVDDTDSPADMIDALPLAAFTAGTQPHARGTRLDEVRADASLLPPGAVIARTARDLNCEALLGTGPGWTIRVARWRGGGGAAGAGGAPDRDRGRHRRPPAALARRARHWQDDPAAHAEAAQWLRNCGPGHQNVAFAAPVTLAELYALRGGKKNAADIRRVPEAVGQYL